MKIGYIQITRECNQKCIICSNPPTEKSVDLQTVKKEIAELKKNGYSEVILTGGEPTLRAELPEIITYCLSRKIEPRIITNGQKTANFEYLQKLKNAGLKHLHLSIYSYIPKIQGLISKNKDSLQNVKKTLENIKKLGSIGADINITINKYNAPHLSETVKWIVKNYPFLNHFVFNNLDPHMNRVEKHPEAIPALLDFELPLYQSLKFLESRGKTFRVERVPLCYLPEFEWCSTETRKIVKKEDRTVYFLDQRGKFRQENFFYEKAECCKVCFLNEICAGLYGGNRFYDMNSLFPVFVNPKDIIFNIRRLG